MILTTIINKPSDILSFGALAVGFTTIIYYYGKQMLKERWTETNYPKDTITTDMIYQYLKEQGCNAWHVSPERNTTNWSAFLVKDGKCYVAKVFTDNRKILGYEDSLA